MDHSEETNLEIKARNMLLGMLEIDQDLSNSREIGRWADFRTSLVEDSAIDHLRADRSFKDGLFLVINLIDALTEIDALLNQDQERFRRLSNFIYDYFLGECAVGEASNHAGVLKLIEILPMIKFSMANQEVTCLRLTLETIAIWQEALLKMHKELKK